MCLSAFPCALTSCSSSRMYALCVTVTTSFCPLLDASVPSFDDRIQRWLWQYHTRPVQCFAAIALTSCNLAHPAYLRKALRTLFVHTEFTVVFPF